MRDPTKGHDALRRGRISLPHAEYFVTVCTDNHRNGLTSAAIASLVLAEMREMDSDATWQLRCAVVMPDHVHVLFVLGQRLSLGKAIARLKSKTSAALAAVAPSLEWERNFYDHHVRPAEDRLPLFLYIFLNPYRAGLCSRTESWRWYYCREEDWAWFKDWLEAERPIPEWLAK